MMPGSLRALRPICKPAGNGTTRYAAPFPARSFMFYDTRLRNHGLKPDPFKALVVPRPIGWIGSVDAQGRPNLAPYSFFNGVADRPPMVMFSSAGAKDSLSNVQATGEFTCSLATWALRDAMNMSSAPVSAGVDEF